MTPVSNFRGLRYGNWNAHSVLNKKPEIESLLHIHNLDILTITETYGSRTETKYGKSGVISLIVVIGGVIALGGGVMILVRNNLIVSPITISNLAQKHLDCVGINIFTAQYKIQFLGVYAPPNIKIPTKQWTDLIRNCTLPHSIILIGDFNAH